MTRSSFAKLTILVGAAAAALLLTIYRPSPEGLIPFGVGQAEVRAAPGAPGLKPKANYDLVALRVFNQTLVRIRDNYVDPTRIDAKKMLIAALERVQRNIAEVLVDVQDDGSALTVHVNDKTQVFSIADVDSVWKLASRLKEIFRFIQANMNPTSDAAQIEYAAVNGMLSTLDPHTDLLDPDAAKDMDQQTSGKFGGIGIVIGMRKDKTTKENKLTVMSLIPGDTPAMRAGLKAGDHMVRINGEPTSNLTITEAMSRLRGDPQTKVMIDIGRLGVDGTKPYELTRDVIHVSHVHAHLLPGNVGYLQIEQFSAEVANDMRRSMDDLRKQGVKAWVLDLRNNPGGLLDQAVRVADLFIDSGTIVTTVGYAGKQREEKRASGQHTDHLPLAVLVDEGSASASEIVAGALKNLDRAVIIGRTTFGKGSVQVLFDYDDGSKLKLTIAQYLTPGDVSIQAVGITPDIELDRVYVPEKIASYKDVLRLLRPINHYREADQNEHLTSMNAREGDKPSEVVRYIEVDKKAKKAVPVDDDDDNAVPADDDDAPIDGSDKFSEDFPITFARDLVSPATESHRHDLLREVRGYVEKRVGEEDAIIASALSKLSIDWTTAPKAAPPHLVATITTDKAGNKVTAGDSIAITGTITNSGAGPAYHVHARAKTDDWVFEGSELVFGKIDPGQTRTFTTYVKAPKSADSRVDDVVWEFTEANGAPVEVAPSKLAIAGLDRPQFEYSYQLLDDGNGDGLLQPGDTVRVHVSVKNVGKGAALNTTAMFQRNAAEEGITVNKGRFELKKIAAGETRTMDFTFDLGRQFADKEAVFDLTVYDTDLREGLNEKIKFPISPAGPAPQVAKGMVRANRDLDVREGASEDAPVIGHLKKGTVVALTGKEEAFDRVEVEAGRPGFVAAQSVSAAAGAPTPAGFSPVWQMTPPSIALNVPSQEVTGDHFTLTGAATDDTHVEDIYILVSNRDSKIDGKKVYYASNRGKKNGAKLDFSTSIPLWPGNNAVTVVARESNDVKTVQTVFILRHDGGKNPAAQLATPESNVK